MLKLCKIKFKVYTEGNWYDFEVIWFCFSGVYFVVFACTQNKELVFPSSKQGLILGGLVMFFFSMSDSSMPLLVMLGNLHIPRHRTGFANKYVRVCY